MKNSVKNALARKNGLTVVPALHFHNFSHMFHSVAAGFLIIFKGFGCIFFGMFLALLLSQNYLKVKFCTFSIRDEKLGP